MQLLFDFFQISSPWGVLSAVIDFLVVYLLIYQVLVLIRGTRAIQMLIGLVLVIIFYFLSKDQYLGLSTVNWALNKFIGSIIIIIVILFQVDIRRGLSKFGTSRLFGGLASQQDAVYVEELVRAAANLAEERIGALIAIERDADLSLYADDAIPVDARLTREMLYAIFNPANRNPLHDGAVVVRDGRIVAAGCFVPLTSNPRVDKSLGTRHRAAIGLSEDTSAVVLVVSEETGIVSVAIDGKLTRRLDSNELRELLQRSLGANARRREGTAHKGRDAQRTRKARPDSPQSSASDGTGE